MPSQMMDQGLAGLMALTRQSQGDIRSGANQFYDNQRYAGDQAMGRFGALSGALQGGFGSVAGGLQSGFGKVGGQIQGMWDNSLGMLPQFMNPAQRLQQQYSNQGMSPGRRGPTMRYI